MENKWSFTIGQQKKDSKHTHTQQDIMKPLTKFSLQSPLNCSNFCDMRSWALPTALRIVPKTTKTQIGQTLNKQTNISS